MNKFVRIGVRVGVSVLLLAYLAFLGPTGKRWARRLPICNGATGSRPLCGCWTVAQLVRARRWQLLAGALGICGSGAAHHQLFLHRHVLQQQYGTS